MKYPAFINFPRTLMFTCLCLLIGLAIFVSLFGLIPICAGYLVLDGLILSILFGCLSVLLWYVISFAYLDGSNKLQEIINYFALVILAIFVWLGLDHLLLYLFFPIDVFISITKCIPMKIVFGMLVFTFLILFYSRNGISNDSSEENSEEYRGNPEFNNAGDGEISRNPDSKMQWIEKIAVKVGQEINIIAVSDILFIQAEGDYVMIQTTTGHFIKEKTMKYFEECLPPAKFVRIHRSTIVNINMISRIELYEKQLYRITLKSGQQLKASVSGYKLLKDTLQL